MKMVWLLLSGCAWVTTAAAGCRNTVVVDPASGEAAVVRVGELRPVSTFAGGDPGNSSSSDSSNSNNNSDVQRARALFLEANRVFSHPRCRNCHPAGDTPLQGDDGRLHDPPVARGPRDRGVPALHCTSCHQDQNLELARVPGAPSWHLAPASMAWAGKSAAAICAQLKDPTRNGGRTLAQVAEHVRHDALVGWAWNPGHDRTPAPGTQAAFADLVDAWIDSGAHCPTKATP